MHLKTREKEYKLEEKRIKQKKKKKKKEKEIADGAFTIKGKKQIQENINVNGQPLFALTKEIQFRFPNEFGPQK